MPKNYTSLISELREKLKECKSPHDIANIKAHYLGKTGIVTNEFGKLKDASLEERKELGKSLNILKGQTQELITLQLVNMEEQDLDYQLQRALLNFIVVKYGLNLN